MGTATVPLPQPESFSALQMLQLTIQGREKKFFKIKQKKAIEILPPGGNTEQAGRAMLLQP